MPQLEQVDTFASQLFWLLTIFIPLYFLLWKVALPRISATLENRQQRIDHDLTRANELAEQAEEVLAAYEARLAQARGNAHEEHHAAATRAAAESERRHAELTAKLARDAEAARARIGEARDAAVSSVSGVAREVAGEMVERLAGERPNATAVVAAVDAALQERR